MWRHLRNIIIIALVLYGAAMVSMASAAGTTISKPANNSDVNRTFALTGTTDANCAIGLQIDDKTYVKPGDRAMLKSQLDANGGGDGPTAGSADASGHFSIDVDLQGNDVLFTFDGPQAKDYHTYSVSSGEHTFKVSSLYCANDTSVATVTLNVVDDTKDDTQAQASSSPEESVSPSPSPGLHALAGVAGASTKPDYVSAWWLLVGFLVGGLLTALAEWSAIRFHGGHAKPHGR